MVRVRCRNACRVAGLALSAAVIAVVTTTPVVSGAATIEQTKAQIAALSAKLAQEERTSEITSNEYDADEVKYANISHLISGLEVDAAKKRAQLKVTGAKLVRSVVNAYVFGSAAAQTIALFNQNVTSSDARNVYETEVIGNLNQLRDQYAKERDTLNRTLAHEAVLRSHAAYETSSMHALLAESVADENQTQDDLDTVTARLRVEIINYEIAAGVAAAKEHDTAGEEEAIAAASEVGGQSAANQVIEAEQQAIQTVAIAEVGTSAQGLAAVAAAETQIGVPYVWGGETPGEGFDCSGLVQWAWAKAGITIPRTTETQWPDLVHVPLTELEPGDLLFYYNLDGDDAVDHVVMYVGSGPWGVDTTIAAAHTGTDISLAPLFTAGLIGAARP